MGNSEFGNIIKSYLLDWCTKYHMKSCILSFFLVYVLFGIHEVKYPLNFVPAQEDVRLTNHLSDGAIADGSGFMAEYVTNQMIDSLSAVSYFAGKHGLTRSCFRTSLESAV